MEDRKPYYKWFQKLIIGGIIMLDSKENAAFERCIDVMARLIEKYGNEDDTRTKDKAEESIKG